MPALLDVSTLLMPTGTYNSSQTFPALALYPRHLATCAFTIAMLTPPAAAATFVLEVASTQAGVYSPIATHVWPAGVAGSKQLQLGANSSIARVVNNTSVWLRLNLTTTGALTGSAWLTKPTDGGPGLGTEPGDILPAL